MFYSEPYKTAVQLQRLIREKAVDPKVRPAELSGLSRAFCELEETKRKLRMKPLPKAIDVSIDGKAKTKAKAQAPPSFTEA